MASVTTSLEGVRAASREGRAQGSNVLKFYMSSSYIREWYMYIIDYTVVL